MKRLFLLAVAIISATGFINSQTQTAAIDSSKFAPYWWHSKDMYDNLPDIRNEIVFLGNSITDGAEWFELLDNKKCINRGISADITEGILLRLDAITKLQPKKLFIMIGVNDLSRNMTPAEVAANYRKILDGSVPNHPAQNLHPERPPCQSCHRDGKEPHKQTLPEIMELNSMLKEWQRRWAIPTLTSSA
jgi:hypothetical protein